MRVHEEKNKAAVMAIEILIAYLFFILFNIVIFIVVSPLWSVFAIVIEMTLNVLYIANNGLISTKLSTKTEPVISGAGFGAFCTLVGMVLSNFEIGCLIGFVFLVATSFMIALISHLANFAKKKDEMIKTNN